MTAVLDASALLALLWREPGHDIAATYIPGAIVSTVNLSEVYAKCADRGLDLDTVRGLLTGLQLTIVDFDSHQAFVAGDLRSRTRKAGLSLGDRACLAAASVHKAQAVTADRAWTALGLSLTITVIR